jgi:putative ABC transport system permease protein
MSTATAERPAAQHPAARGAPARRAVIRWAWRLFRREWRQQLLILGLLTAAVAATILGAAVGSNTPPPRNAGFGGADHLVVFSGDPVRIAADVAVVRRRFGTVDVVENRPLVTGTARVAQLRAQDPHGAFAQPMLSLLSGRYPADAGEVAMTEDLAATYGVHVGDSWTGAGHAYRVVGLVENPQNLLDTFALVAPDTPAAGGQATVLFRGSGPQVDSFTFPDGAKPQAPVNSSGLAPATVVLLIAIIGLVFVGLVAVAGFSMVAQRRLRALGMLSALGATDRDVRLVMVANGAVVGIVAAVAGAVLGLAAWIPYAPHLQVSTHHRISRADVPWWLVATTMILAVVTAVLAARRPARTTARLSVMAALSGRPAVPRPVHRSAIPGVLLLAIGLVLMAFSGGWGTSTTKDSLFKVVGLLAIAAGLLLFAPACVTMLSALGRRVPIASRLAVRDLGRYRARSGPALAAISFAIFIAMIISLLATGRYADPLDYFAPNLPADQLLIYPPGAGPGSALPDKRSGPPPGAAANQAAAGAIAASLTGSTILGLDTTEATLVQPVGTTMLRGVMGTVYVATPAVLSRYGIAPGAIDPDTMMITARPGLDRVADVQLRTFDDPDGVDCPPGTCIPHPKIQRIAQLPTDASGPNLLVTQHAIDTLRLQVTPAAWLIQTSAPLTAEQINTARQAALAAGMTIETKSQAPSLAQLRNYSTVAGMVLALAVLAMTVGLIRGEAASDMRTLTANGASGGTRRGITATTAGALGLTGALLGSGVAYLTTIALFRSELSERLMPVPVLDIVLIVVGLPVVAAAGGWLLTGREPAAISHHAID